MVPGTLKNGCCAFSPCKWCKVDIIYHTPADMAELVDALVSGTSGSNALEVRVFLSAPHSPFVWRAFWGCSSVDRALRSHRRGRGFESHQLHQKSNRPCGDFIFGGWDENTRDVGLYRRKKADGSMPVCASKFCKVGEANPISSTKICI